MPLRGETKFVRVGEYKPIDRNADIVDEDLALLPVACMSGHRFFQEKIEDGIRNAVVATEEDVDGLLLKVLTDLNRSKNCCVMTLMEDPLIVRLISNKYKEIKVKDRLAEGLDIEDTNPIQTIETTLPTWYTQKIEISNRNDVATEKVDLPRQLNEFEDLSDEEPDAFVED